MQSKICSNFHLTGLILHSTIRPSSISKLLPIAYFKLIHSADTSEEEGNKEEYDVDGNKDTGQSIFVEYFLISEFSTEFLHLIFLKP